MLQRFTKEDYKGREVIQNQQIGLTKPDPETNLATIKYMNIQAVSVGKAKDPYKIREPIYHSWEEFL